MCQALFRWQVHNSKGERSSYSQIYRPMNVIQTLCRKENNMMKYTEIGMWGAILDQLLREGLTRRLQLNWHPRRRSQAAADLDEELCKQLYVSHWALFNSVTPWTVAHQAPPSMGFSRQGYWSGLPFPSPGDLPDPGIEPRSPTLQADSLPSEPPRKLSQTMRRTNGRPLSLEHAGVWCAGGAGLGFREGQKRSRGQYGRP